MKHASIIIVIGLQLLLAACSAGAQPGNSSPAGGASGGGSTAAQTETPAGGGGGGGGGTSLVEAAKAVKHACSLLPADLAAAIVPGGSAPVEEPLPARCSVYSAKVAMEFTVAPYDTGGRQPPAGADIVSGLGAGAWIEHLSQGNWYMTVLLAPDAGSLYAEVNNQDGKDHKDEVVNLAKAVLAKLGG